MRDRMAITMFVAAFCGMIFEVAYLMNSMQAAPTAADPMTRHIVPFMSHGVTYYVTPMEKSLFCYILPPIVIFLVITGLYFVFADRIETHFKGGERPNL